MKIKFNSYYNNNKFFSKKKMFYKNKFLIFKNQIKNKTRKLMIKFMK